MDYHLHLHSWVPGDVQSIIIIVHGMAEHGGRYESLARKLNAMNIAVYAPDLRGHGMTAGEVAALGYKENGDFFGKSIGDLRALHDKLIEQHPNKKIIMLGHSMGSMLTRAYASVHGADLAGIILSGTGGDPGFLGKIGFFIAKMISWFRGRKHESPLLEKLSFGKFNDGFKPARTDFDWLSRDEAEVDKYINDPYCGTTFTAGFWIDLLKGVQYINSGQAYSSTPKDLPIYIFSGDKDPVGDNGKGVQEVYNAYLNEGINNLKYKLYSEGRHEMLNESNREEVISGITSWLETSINPTV